MRHYERLAHRYFQAWNAHDVSSLKGLFAESVTLRDWNGEHIGKVAVAAANAAIFSAEPKISIAVQQCHVAESTRTTTCEIACVVVRARRGHRPSLWPRRGPKMRPTRARNRAASHAEGALREHGAVGGLHEHLMGRVPQQLDRVDAEDARIAAPSNMGCERRRVWCPSNAPRGREHGLDR